MYRTIVIAGATTAVIVGAGGAALAATGSDTPTPGTSSTSSSASGHAKAGKHQGKARRMLRHLDHADIVVHTKKHGDVTRKLIRGTVTSVSSSSITVTSADHTVRTFAVSKDTKVRSRTKGTKPAPSTISAVAKGDNVFVGGVARGSAKPVARHIADIHTK